MTIKVLAVESSEWNSDHINQALFIGEYADESEARTEIWRDLVEKRQHRAYLLFDRHPVVKFWRKPVGIIWGGLYKGMPRIYQESLDKLAEKKAAKLYGLNA